MGQEESRQHSPLLSQEDGHDILNRTRFGGLDIALPDTANLINQQGTTMMTRAGVSIFCSDSNSSIVIPSQAQNPVETILVRQSTAVNSLSYRIQKHISEQVGMALFVQIGELSHPTLNGNICVLLELDNSTLKGMTDTKIPYIKKNVEIRARGLGSTFRFPKCYKWCRLELSPQISKGATSNLDTPRYPFWPFPVDKDHSMSSNFVGDDNAPKSCAVSRNICINFSGTASQGLYAAATSRMIQF
jgi:hypothetical protein